METQTVHTDDIILAGDGAMSALMRGVDWGASPLGPVEHWPPCLRIAVNLCLHSQFPIVIFWGPELRVLYNDAYRVILVDKHPAALGQPAQQIFPEVWPTIRPLLQGVLQSGQAIAAHDLLLPLVSDSVPQERYFTFSYSPILDEQGTVRGVFCPVTETTERVQRERREQALRIEAEAARDQVHAVLESMTDSFVAFDAQWRITAINASAAAAMHHRREDLLGKVYWGQFPPTRETNLYPEFHRAMAERVPVVFESYYPPWACWYEVHAYPAADGGLAVFFRDITERKRREAIAAFLAELQDDLAQLTTPAEIMRVTSAKMGAFLRITNCLFADIDEAHDQAQVVYAWNVAEGMPNVVGTYRLADYITEAFRQAGRAGETIVIDDTQTDPRVDAARYAAVGFHAYVTVPFQHQGEWRYLFTVNDAVPRQWQAEEIALIEEFTNRVFPRLERARAEAALRVAHQQTTDILESIGDAFYALDRDWRFTYVNRKAEALWGRRREEVLGKRLWDEFPQAVGSPTYQAHYQAVAEQRAVECEAVSAITHSWVGVNIYPSTAGLSVYFRDITARKQAEAERERLLTELQRINGELQQFAHIVSHDLGEPLRTMRNFIHLLARELQGTVKGDAEEYMAFVTDAAQRMQQMLTDLLAYTQAGRTPEFTAVDCEAVLAQVLGALQTRITECEAVITHDPLPRIQGDATRLGQVLQNLIGNALKFYEEKPPRIHLSAVKKDHHWEFSLRDNGIGIPPQQVSKLFQVFQRAHGKEYAGSGIGLAICKKIIEQHGGRIWVESKPREGSIFHFTISDGGGGGRTAF